jgi:hypothetical protein
MSDEIHHQTIIDAEHLKLLSLGYMISGAASAFFSLFGLFYVFMGAIMSLTFSRMPAPAGGTGQEPPAFVGWIFGGIGLAFFLVLLTLALLKFRAAICLRRRTSRTFCMVVAGISCLGVPYGTVLGVFTFIVLGRDSVTRLFNSPPASSLVV